MVQVITLINLNGRHNAYFNCNCNNMSKMSHNVIFWYGLTKSTFNMQ